MQYVLLELADHSWVFWKTHFQNCILRSVQIWLRFSKYILNSNGCLCIRVDYFENITNLANWHAMPENTTEFSVILSSNFWIPNKPTKGKFSETFKKTQIIEPLPFLVFKWKWQMKKIHYSDSYQQNSLPYFKTH